MILLRIKGFRSFFLLSNLLPKCYIRCFRVLICVQGTRNNSTGRVELGIMKVGDEVEVLGLKQVCSLRHFLYIGLPFDFHASLLSKMPFADFFCFYILCLELVMCNGVFFDGHYYIALY